MANRRSSPPPQAPQLTAAQMRNQISRIQRCIRELQDFDPTTVRNRSDPGIKSLEVSINQVLTQTFGDEPERELYAAAAYLDRAALTVGALRHRCRKLSKGSHKEKNRQSNFLIEQSKPLRIRSPTSEKRHPKSPPPFRPSSLKTC
jgi:hypothetical protein